GGGLIPDSPWSLRRFRSTSCTCERSGRHFCQGRASMKTDSSTGNKGQSRAVLLGVARFTSEAVYTLTASGPPGCRRRIGAGVAPEQQFSKNNGDTNETHPETDC